jgi:hypothetical protein
MATEQGPSLLCDVCNKLDLNDLLPFCDDVKQPSHPGSYRRWPGGRMERCEPRKSWIPENEGNFIFMRVDYGTVEEVAGRRNSCRMCDFVVKMLDRNSALVSLQTSRIHLRFHSVGLAQEEWKVRLTPAWARWSIPRCWFDIHPNLNRGGSYHNDQDWQVVAYLAPRAGPQSSADTGSRFSSIPTCIGREAHSKCSATLLNSWLKQCRKEHDEDDCPTPDNFAQLKPVFKFRLTNIKNVCFESFKNKPGTTTVRCSQLCMGEGCETVCSHEAEPYKLSQKEAYQSFQIQFMMRYWSPEP